MTVIKQRHPSRGQLMSPSLALLVVLFGQQLLYAQEVSDYQVKAAYLYNFAKFVEWPNETLIGNTVPIRLCILNDRAFELQLSEFVKDKTIKSRPIVVVLVKTGEEARACHVLFIGSSQNGQAPHIIDFLQGASTLTVGETRGFLEEGGILNFVLQENQMHFQVNHKAATQAGLRMSSKLLSLAKLVIE
jgi:hypothetical protein